MPLLTLPPEILHLILTFTPTPAYLQALQTCRRLRRLGQNNRALILHHLRQTPGLDSFRGLALECYVNEVLFGVLVCRARRELYGAQFVANCKRFEFGDAQGIDARASYAHDDCEGVDVVLVPRGKPGVIVVYRAEAGTLKLEEEAPPPWDQDHGEIGDVEVLKTAMFGPYVYVLYRVRPPVKEEYELDMNSTPGLGTYAAGLQSKPRAELYLTIHWLWSGMDSVRIYGFPDRSEYEPTALAVNDRDTVVIAWRHLCDHEDEVVRYSLFRTALISADECGYKSHSLMRRCRCGECAQCLHGGTMPVHNRGSVEGLELESGNLLYYFKMDTVSSMFQEINQIHFAGVEENDCTVRFAESLNLSFSVARPFYGAHPVCSLQGPQTRTLLSFGTATHRTEGWTVACVLKTETDCPGDCAHSYPELEDGISVDNWTVAARLWGFARPTSSLGCIVATSQQGTRIAVANWKTLYVWALNPDTLADDNEDGFYPPSSYSTRTGLIELRPIVLQLHAVCFRLRFMRGDNELLAITDRGVMYWDLSPQGKGERTSHRLEVQARSG
ncbi:F-box domain protein [Aspergillus sp. HF37]|nr:F-box domain protein [Aspergillus sp. HF37]